MQIKGESDVGPCFFFSRPPAAIVELGEARYVLTVSQYLSTVARCCPVAAFGRSSWVLSFRWAADRSNTCRGSARALPLPWRRPNKQGQSRKRPTNTRRQSSTFARLARTRPTPTSRPPSTGAVAVRTVHRGRSRVPSSPSPRVRQQTLGTQHVGVHEPPTASGNRERRSTVAPGLCRSGPGRTG
jgi:hypothetical protein